jgi:hypothetical protein
MNQGLAQPQAGEVHRISECDITPVLDKETTGVLMTGPEHFLRAEELAAKAAEYLGHGDGQDSAAVWAAVAQVHATLALATAAETVRTRPDHRA